jgi:hypothetical protein
MNRRFMDGFVKILILEAVFLVLLFLFFTALRLFFNDLFLEVCSLYSEYFMSDISMSLVLSGE